MENLLRESFLRVFEGRKGEIEKFNKKFLRRK
jgi:hypothetical protein